MKNSFKLGLATALATMASSPLAAQDAMTFDAKVNEVFANITGPFVNLIFAPFPGTDFLGS
jgi:AGCS family alanine or glycine:cation symporter